MDPLSVLSLVEACAGLTVTAGKLAIGLKSLGDNYKQSTLTFRSLSSQCKLFATSVRAIQAWMEEAPELNTVDDSIWEQLADSLECAKDAILALENELVATSGTSVNTFWKKANVVWNLQTLKDLEACIHKQVFSLSIILQIMSLPTLRSQTEGLREQSSVFEESRMSARSLRAPSTSTPGGGNTARNSTARASSTIMTRFSQLPQFDFDETLLTSQVYLRNREMALAMKSRTAGFGSQDAATSVGSWDLPPQRGTSRDAGTSVNMWDLPPQRGDSHAFDLQAVARDISEGNIEQARTALIHHYEVLKNKYKKVKLLYYRGQDQIELLRHEIEALKANGPDAWPGVAVAF